MKNPTITIMQNEDGTEFLGCHFDIDPKDGLTVGSTMVLMISEFLQDEACCLLMMKRAMKNLEKKTSKEYECQKDSNIVKLH